MSTSGDNRGDVAGVGHRVFDAALKSAEQEKDVLAVIPGLKQPVAVFAVRDAITTGPGVVRTIVLGVEGVSPGWQLVHDWELVRLLNLHATRPLALARLASDLPGALVGSLPEHVALAQEWLTRRLEGLTLPFRKAQLDPLLLLVPAAETGKRVPQNVDQDASGRD